MPSAVFPRFAEHDPVDLDPLQPKSRGIINESSAGTVGARATTAKGFTWTETYPLLKIGEPDTEEFLSWLNWAYRNNIIFTVDHPTTPGSGNPPNGTGTAGVTVSGVNSGDTINVTAGTYEPGDLVSIAGYNFVMQITETATDVMHIDPPIIVPTAGGEDVTTTGVTLNCYLQDYTRRGIFNSFWYAGVTATFREVPN